MSDSNMITTYSWAAGVMEQAIEYYDKALDIDPKNADVLINKGEVLYQSKKYNEAIECYDKALAIDPNDVAILGYSLY
jgi:tetratricopeptide (TPR) repeat protein